AGGANGLGYGGDVGNFRGEFDDYGTGRGALHGLVDLRRLSRVVRETFAARLDVRARDVQLVAVNAVAVFQNLYRFDVLLHRVPEDVRDDARVVAPQFRQFLFHERASADILQPDGVKHSAVGLDDAPRGVAPHRLRRQTLRANPAEFVQINQPGHVQPVAARAAGRQHGIVEADARDFD